MLEKLSTIVQVQLVVFCYKDVHMDINETKDNKRTLCSCPQTTISESLTVNMTQQIEMRARGKSTEMARKHMKGTYIPIK